MKSLLIPLLALSACLAVCPFGLSNDLPTAPPIEELQISPLEVILTVGNYELDAIVEFDAAASAMEKKILAKLHCESVLVVENGRTAKFRAVYGDSEENKTFSKYTPSASLEMYVTNPAAFDAFEPGRDYLVTLSPAPEAITAETVEKLPG